MLKTFLMSLNMIHVQ